MNSSSHPALLRAAHSSLLVVDVQERLLPHIDGWQQLQRRVLWLVRLAQRLAVPVMASEQYRQGIGATVAAIASELPAGAVVEKRHFSCVAAGCLAPLPAYARPQIVVCGIEAHVCVLQTVLDLLHQGKQVFVVADAVGSRTADDRRLALERLARHGAEIVSTEMVAFEWLHEASTDRFRTIHREFLRGC